MMHYLEWLEHYQFLQEELAKAESKVWAVKQEMADWEEEPTYVECFECGAPIAPDNFDGICYECQTKLHALGLFDMDGDGWVIR